MIYKGFDIGASPMFPGYVPSITWPSDIYATPLWPSHFLHRKRFRWNTPEEAIEVAKYYIDKCLKQNKGDIAYIHRNFS